MKDRGRYKMVTHVSMLMFSFCSTLRTEVICVSELACRSARPRRERLADPFAQPCTLVDLLVDGIVSILEAAMSFYKFFHDLL